MKIVPSEEYRVERTVLTTRVFRGGQGRLDPTPDVPSPPPNPQASTKCGESRRVRATMRTSSWSTARSPTKSKTTRATEPRLRPTAE